MANENSALPSVVDKQVEQVERQAARVVAGLRALADRVQIEAEVSIQDARKRTSGYSSYANAASRVVHEIQWGIANLPLDLLVTDAAAADVYAEQDKTTSEA